MPKLPPLKRPEDEIVQEELIQEDPVRQDLPDPSQSVPKQAPKKVSRSKKANPYDDQDTQYWPILIGIGVFLPTVILLCKSM